ncbi:MAG TPA: MATE family efflux transporter [Mycobacteriales bacterium]|nr:MATE family efflux transporter [Mycobacteriales bacterium]
MSEASYAADVPTRRLLSLTASAFVVLAAEPTYLLIDTAVVGHLGTRQLAALGIAVAVVGLLLVIGDFVEYGTTGRVARAYGAGRLDLARSEGVQASWLGLATGVVLAGAGELFASPLAHVLAGDRGAVSAAAVEWLRIGLAGLPGVLLVLAGNGWMRGLQRTRQPVVIVLAANVVSAVLCPLLVYAAGLGLRGSAVANLAGQAVGAVLFLAALEGPKRVVWPTIRAQLAVGRDLVIRNVGFQASFLTAAAVAARMGAAQLAAHQVGMQLDEFSALLLDSVAIAAQSLVGAALGSGDAGAARTVTWQIARWGGWAGVAFAAGYAALWWPIPQVFSSAPPVVHQMHVMWPWFCVLWLPAGVLFALDGVLIGAGDVRFMAVLTLIAGLGAFVPIDVLALHFEWGLGGVWAGLLGFYVVRLIGMLIRARGTRWQVLGAASSR